MSDSLQPHGLQHTRPPCPSAALGVYSNPCPLSQWCHPNISSCRPLLPPSIFPSIRVFSNESALSIRWPKCWSVNFSISPSNEYSGLISFGTDWFDFLAVQGTLKSLLQHHTSKGSEVNKTRWYAGKWPGESYHRRASGRPSREGEFTLSPRRREGGARGQEEDNSRQRAWERTQLACWRLFKEARGLQNCDQGEECYVLGWLLGRIRNSSCSM